MSSTFQATAAHPFSSLGVLGAGLMGSGIAMAAAEAGLEVILLDTTRAAAEKGKDYAARRWSSQCERGQLTAEEMAARLARIRPTTAYSALAGCAWVIEAVFEDYAVKAEVTRQAEAIIAADALFASNTSTLPIGRLAEASSRPQQFIGLHFFSPAEKMPLVEVILGRATSETTLAQALEFVRRLGKTPIVVNDSPGFYTTRVFMSYVGEGMELLAEGYPAALIEAAGLTIGMPVGPLALADEVSIALIYRIARQNQAERRNGETASLQVMHRMVDTLGRTGRKSGAGFYDYPAEGRKRLWPELARHFPPTRVVDSSSPEREKVMRSGIPGDGAGETANGQNDEALEAAAGERLLLIQSAEAVRCLQEGVLRATADADVGARLGWGYPASRGGPLAWLQRLGLEHAVDALERLAMAYGARFAPTWQLRAMAANGELFYRE